jgi:hypothetical protein
VTSWISSRSICFRCRAVVRGWSQTAGKSPTRSVAVPDPENGTFLLELVNPPEDDQVRYLILAKGGQRTVENGRVIFRLALTVKEHPWLRKLAKTIGQVVSYRHVHKTRKRYDIRDWRFVAPRTKEALIQLANAIREFRGQVAAAKRCR